MAAQVEGKTGSKLYGHKSGADYSDNLKVPLPPPTHTPILARARARRVPRSPHLSPTPPLRGVLCPLNMEGAKPPSPHGEKLADGPALAAPSPPDGVAALRGG